MSDITDWASIAQKLHQDYRALESKLAEVTKQRDYAHQKCREYRIVALGAEDELEKMTAQRDAFRDELSKVMPPDYKDWWENDKNEWPIVARLTIESKKRLIDMDRETIERMERELAEVTQQCDELQSQLSEMTARAISMVFMIPPETIAGDLQKFKDECKDLLERSKVKGGEG